MGTALVMVLLVASTLSAQEPRPQTWDVEGVKRTALVAAPKKPGTPPPLVFVFHGHGGTARSAMRMGIHTRWPEAVVVYPQGLPTPGKLTDPEGQRSGWQHGPGDQKDRDLKFFDAMLASLKKEYGIEEKRIYSTGHSNGGGFTYTLWATRGEVFAAVAPSSAVAGGYATRLKPLPVLHVAGEEDALVKYEWQQRMMTHLRKVNGCDDTGKPAGKYCTEYGSSKGPRVVTYIHPGGHQFPAEASARIVEFFKAHVKP